MRIGVLGSGFMGGTHARAYAKLPDVDVVAVSSLHRDKAAALAAEGGARATTDNMAIIGDPSIEAISNTLPTHLHAEFTIAALEAGKHVLLEKPFALDVADCDRMIAAAKASGKMLVVAHVLRFWGAYVSLAGIVASGRLGRPMSAAATRLSQLPAWADWFTDPASSGGAVFDLCVHDFDAVNWVLGTPKSVYARGHALKPGLWNDVHASLDYGGAQAFVEGSEFMPIGYPFTAGLRVLCEDGVVEFRFQAGGVSVEQGGGSSLVVHEPGRSYPLEPAPGDAYENQAAYFVDCVRSGRAPTRGTAEQARLAIRTAEAARRSLETGSVVAV